ncbi:hypothetical protein MMP66_16900 [Acinetobacter dispersus]|uniref:hypothetical protein n=1 Tax=Acinetobacter dispersus TaxID=70348 RepID=UPI001F4A4A55|nr:hypothetical protein [Acinetobacter dispersus]MCH7395932.1 hypothetical protein [Acinetobacter dispersus]
MKSKQKPNAQIISEAIDDLHNQEQVVTRETLASSTGLKLSIIDDRLSYLVDNEQIIRVQRGVFIPAVRHRPSRIMSKTVLPDGTVKIEIDEEILTLTPREARNLGNMMVGEAMQYSNIELGHHMAIIQSEVSGQIRKLSKHVNKFFDDDKQGKLL